MAFATHEGCGEGRGEGKARRQEPIITTWPCPVQAPGSRVNGTLLLTPWGDNQNTNNNDSGKFHLRLSTSQHNSKHSTCFI